MSPVDPAALCGALKFTRRALATALRAELTAKYEALAPPAGEAFNTAPATVGRRALRNTCLGYLSKLGDDAAQALCLAQFKSASCMVAPTRTRTPTQTGTRTRTRTLTLTLTEPQPQPQP